MLNYDIDLNQTPVEFNGFLMTSFFFLSLHFRLLLGHQRKQEKEERRREARLGLARRDNSNTKGKKKVASSCAFPSFFSMSNPRVFFDISMDGDLEGRLVMELYADKCPKTVENFRSLCTGEKGTGPVSGLPLHLKGCTFHRIIKGFMMQGGDFTHHNGTGGESIYGEKFDDEKGGLELKHDRRGVLSMANSGENTNSSQFFILFDAQPHLNGRHCVFGKVILGLGFLKFFENVETDSNDKPKIDVTITDCGELPEGADPGICNVLKDGDMLPDFPNDAEKIFDKNSLDINWWLNSIESIKTCGSDYFKKGNYFRANKKYHKALRYLDSSWSREDIDSEKLDRLTAVKETLMTNSAACKLKMKDYEGVISDCDFVLNTSENNVKALYRRAQAHICLKQYEEALKDLTKALNLSPKDSAIRSDYASIKKSLQERKEKERKAFAKMFS